jgi:putative transposase
LRRWRLKCPSVADNLEEVGARFFTFTRLSEIQWQPALTANPIERLRTEFKRRIKAHTVLPPAKTASMLFGALLVAGQIDTPKVDGCLTLRRKFHIAKR